MGCQYLILFISVSSLVVGFVSGFNYQLYQDVLDEELCEQQLVYLFNNSLRYQFYDASFKVPSGIAGANINDFGDYFKCLGIDEIVEDNMEIQGKYCTVLVPIQQEIEWPSWPEWPDWNITIPELNITWPEIDSESVSVINKYGRVQKWAQQFIGVDHPAGGNHQVERVLPALLQFYFGLTLAVCVPKVCTARQALLFLQQRVAPLVNITYNDHYCRLPGDKPFVPADYVAIGIFSLIGLLCALSTIYDLIQKFYFARERSNPLYSSFSVYTNTRRLLTFSSNPGALECVDGIRTISMLWVVVGHSYSLTLTGYVHNQSYILSWMTDIASTWVHAAPITVDTFFMLSGLLIVYTTVGKLSRGRFYRLLHLFYMNRLLRMFPLLATLVLLQSSVLVHISDGPYWNNVVLAAENCRSYWWSTLLHVQNYVNPGDMCLIHTWYLSVDTQLYFVAPIVLFWLWSGPKFAWIALTAAAGLSLVSSSVISFMYNFSAALANFNRLTEFNTYTEKYYFNTLARAPPFFIGMIYGYMLHSFRDRKIRISKLNAILLWTTSTIMMLLCVIAMYPVMQPDHTAQTLDNVLNAYMRAVWATGLGWLIFACAKGYGGPINWFLSLQMWKLPARLSYAVYLVHVPLIMVANGSWVKTHYFTTGETLYRYMSDITISFIAAFFLCVLIDAPFSTLQKILLGGAGGGGKKRPQNAQSREQPGPHDIDTANQKYIVKTAL